MDIGNHIKELLILNDCVILPGFGGFTARYESARIAGGEAPTITPPSKTLGFDPKMVIDDGLMYNHIHRKEGIPVETAKENVLAYIQQIRDTLRRGETFNMPDIGTFKQEKGTIVFIPDKGSNLLADAFGMQSFNFPVAGETEEEQTSDESGGEQTPGKKKKNKTLLIIGLSGAFILIVFLILLFFTPLFDKFNISLNLGNSFDKEENHEPLIPDTAASNSPVDSALKEISSKKSALLYEEKEETATGISEKETKELSENNKKQVVTKKKEFFIIAGTFRNKYNAEKLLKQLISRGYAEAEIVAVFSNFHSVAVKGFENRITATRSLFKYRKELNDPSLWMWKRK